MREGFSAVDFGRPLDIASARDAIPSSAMLRGLMFRSLRPAATSYAPFGLYPAVDYFDACVESARARWPDQPLREGLRRASRLGFPSFADSAAGKLIFGLYRNRVPHLLTLGNAAAKFAGMPGTVSIVEQNQRAAVLRMVDSCFPVDAMHVGAAEGMFAFCAIEAVVGFRTTADAVEVCAEW